jgi:hypothetical protein
VTAIIKAAVAIAAVMIHIFRLNLDGEWIGGDVDTLEVGCLGGRGYGRLAEKGASAKNKLTK